MMNNIKPVKTYVIDLFCGAGGTSTAIHESHTNIEVIACVNHDKNAIMSHAENYPNCMHFIEDIRTIKLSPIFKLITDLRRDDPTCKIAIWASLECTNFSIAKCGPKDPDSRTLADHLFRYCNYLKPDFLWIENVKEFMTWGPLLEDGNPDKTKLGETFDTWVSNIKRNFFSDVYWKDTLISADHGGHTIRNRLFIQFAKDANEIGVPVATHNPKGDNGFEKWRAIREVLDFSNIGKSMFTRKKDFVPTTHKRIFMGEIKFGGKEESVFGYKYYGQGGFVDMNDPCCTLTTKDRVSLVYTKPICLKQNFGTSTARGLDQSSSTLTAVPKQDLVSISGFIHNPQYGGSNRSINDPACTVIARQDKAPLGLTSVLSHELTTELVNIDGERDGRPHILNENGHVTYFVYKASDDVWMQKIKLHMYENGLLDIFVRPLEIHEMLAIQGFPKGYVLKGTKTEQKKYIGNSVEVKVGIALFKSIDAAIQKRNICNNLNQK